MAGLDREVSHRDRCPAAGFATWLKYIRNFAKVESTVACAGATTPGAIQEIKKMGFASIINLRLVQALTFSILFARIARQLRKDMNHV